VLGAGPGDADGVAFLERVIASGVTMLVAPGPEVTSTTPGLPVERA
jgi:hypothetical protein